MSKKTWRVENSQIILSLLILTYSIVFSIATILRHYAFKTRAWDLGIFTQSFWTTLYANKFFYHTCELFVNPSGSFFGVHFSPILFLILPFYRIYTAPETLLIIQSFVIALAALPMYKLAREYNHDNRMVGLTFALAYLFYPAIQWVNWYDFHVQAFLPLFLSFAVYYTTKENWPRYFVFLTLSLMCEEHVAFIASFIGLYIAWSHRKSIISNIKKKNLLTKETLVPSLTVVISVVWYWFTLWQRNTFFPTNPLAINEFLGSPNFSILGAKDPLEIPLMILLKPLNALQALAYNGHLKLLFLFLVFGPLAFYSFRKPAALIPTIPWFIFSLMSQVLDHYALGNQYPAYITAFIFIAAIFGLQVNPSQNIKEPLKKVVACSLIFMIIASPLSPFVHYMFPEKAVLIEEHEELLMNIIAEIPNDAAILTQDNIFPHVSHRLNAYVVPNRFLNTSIHELAINFVNETLSNVEYVLLDNKTDPIATSFVMWMLQTKPEFTLIKSEDNNTIYLYQRKY